MKLFRYDMRPFKTAIHCAIDRHERWKSQGPVAELEFLHHSMELAFKTERPPGFTEPERFMSQVEKLCSCQQHARAHKLVDALGDTCATAFGLVMIAAVAIALRVTILAAIVAAVIASMKCGGLL